MSSNLRSGRTWSGISYASYVIARNSTLDDAIAAGPMIRPVYVYSDFFYSAYRQ